MPGIHKHKSDPRIVHWKKPDTTLAESRAWVETRLASPKCWNFVVHFLPPEYKDQDPHPSWLVPSEEDRKSVLGLCGVHSAPEIGYAFHPSVWGKGIATEAIRGLIQAYWEAFPIGHPVLEGDEKTYLMALTDIWNRSSERVLEKNGFEFWKEQEKEDMRDDNKRMTILHVWRLWKPGHPVAE
ncbi:MAG: hypothetical protein Q9191_002336 [Dirinaria sp. TL-2023a]